MKNSFLGQVCNKSFSVKNVILSSKLKQLKRIAFLLAGFLLLFNANSYAATTLGTCASPTSVTVGSTVSATITVSQTATNPPAYTCTYNQAEGWGKFTATAPVIIFDMGTFSKTWALEVYSGSCGSLTLNSNYCATSTGGGILPMGPFTVGSTYYFRFMNNSSTTGSMTIASLILYNGAGTCANPYPLTLGTAIGSNFYIDATPSTTPAWSTCESTGNNAEGWFSFTATASYSMVDITAINETAAMQVFAGSPCSGGTAVYCLSTLATSGTPSYNWFSTTPGTTYYVRIIETSSTVAMTCNLTVYNAAYLTTDPCTDGTGYVTNNSTLTSGNIVVGYTGSAYENGYAKFITTQISSSATIAVVVPNFTVVTDNAYTGSTMALDSSTDYQYDPCSATGAEIEYGFDLLGSSTATFTCSGLTANTTYNIALSTFVCLQHAVTYNRGWWCLMYAMPTSSDWKKTGTAYNLTFYGNTGGSSYAPFVWVAYTGGCTASAPSAFTASANGSSSSPVYTASGSSVTLSQITTGGNNCGSWLYAWYNGTNYWNGTSFGSATAVYNASYSTISPTISANTTYTCYVEASTGGGTANSPITVDVYALPTITAEADGTTGETVGYNVTVALTSNASGGSCPGTVEFAWSNNGGASGSWWNGTNFTGTSASYTTGYANISTTFTATTTYTCYVECTTGGGPATSAVTVTLESSPIFYNFNTGNTSQYTYNNADINTSTPLFRMSPGASACNQIVVQISTDPTFVSGTSWSQTFSGTYNANTQYDILFNNGFTPSNGTTYYVRAEASANGGTSYSNYSSATFSFTYTSTAGNPSWYQTTQTQFNTDAQSGVTVSGSGVQLTSTSGGSNAITNGSFETGSLSSWTQSVVQGSCDGVSTTHFMGTETTSSTETINGATFQAPSPTPVTQGSYCMVIANTADGFSESDACGSFINAQTGVNLTGVNSITFSQTLADWNQGGCSGLEESSSYLEVIIDPSNSSTGTAGTVVYTSATLTGSCGTQLVATSTGPNLETVTLPNGTYGANCSVKFVWVSVIATGSSFTDAPTVYIDDVATNVVPSGTITSTGVDLASVPGATGWASLNWNQTLNGGTITLAVQKCVSGTWTTVSGLGSISSSGSTGSQSLTSIPVTTSSDSIRVIATLGTTAGGTSPVLTGWTITETSGCTPPTLTASANNGTGTVTAAPGATITLNANSVGGTLCDGGGAFVYAWSDDGGTTFWNGSSFSGGAVYTTADSSISFPASTGTTTYNVYAQCANNSGCATSSSSATAVTVQAVTTCTPPTITAEANGTASSVTIPYNTTVALNATPGGGANCSGSFQYAWSDDGGTTFWNGSAFSGGANYNTSYSSISVPNVTAGATYTAYVECSTNTACSASSAVTISIGTCTSPSLTAKANGTSGTLNACPGTSITLTANPSGGAYCDSTFAWSDDGGTTFWNGSAFSGGSNYSVSYSSINFSLSTSATYTCYVNCTSSGCNNSSAVVINVTPPNAPVFSNYLGTQQLAFNNSLINTTTPYFYASATSTCGGTYNTLLIDINTNSTFTGTDYTQTFSGTYTSGTGYDFQFTNGIPSTNGVTYYVRAKAAGDGGTNYGTWSSGTYSFTYNGTTGNPAWYQQAQAQFSTDALSGTTSNANYVGLTSTSGGANVFTNPSFETTSSVPSCGCSAPTSWTRVGSITNGGYANDQFGWISSSTTDATNGTYSLEFWNDGPLYECTSEAYEANDFLEVYQEVNMTGITSISLSEAFTGICENNPCGDNPNSTTFYLIIDPSNSTSNYLAGTDYALNTNSCTCSSSGANGPTTYTFNGLSYTGTCTVRLVAYVNTTVLSSGAAATYYVDNVQGDAAPSGTATSTAFNIASVQGATKWGSLIWNQTQNGGTITFAVQQYTGGAWANISGYTAITSATDGNNSYSLSGLATSLDSIRVVASFTTTAGAASSPQLNSWEIAPVIAPTLTATANGTSGTDIECSGATVALSANPTNIPSGGCSGSWQYAWYNGTNYWNGSAFSSGTPVYSTTYSISLSSVTSSATYTALVNCSTNAADSSSSSVVLTVVNGSISGLTASLVSPDTGSNRVTTVSWNTVSGATGYDLDYSTDDNTWTNLFTNSNVTTYNHSPGDHPNAPYYYRVRVHTGSAQCGYTSYGPIYTGCDVPGLPTLGSATTTTMTAAIASDNNPAITTYALYCPATGQYVQANGTLGSSAVYQTASTWGTITLTGLTSNTNYCFNEIAQNYQGYTTTGTGAAISATQTFATSSTFSTSGPNTTKWASISSCSGSSEMAWHSGDGCNGSAGAVGYVTSPGDGYGCYLVSPLLNCTGLSSVSMTFTLTSNASTLGDYMAFSIYSTTSSTYYPASQGATPYVVTAINGATLSNGNLLLNATNNCQTITLTWNLTSIPSADRNALYFYLTPEFVEASGTSFNVLFDNIAVNNPTPTACLSTTKTTICGNFQVGPTGDYPSLTAVASALSSSTLTCNTTFNLQTSYSSSSETFPITFSGLSYGSGGPFTVAIRPDTSVSTPLTTSGSSTSALITLSGVEDFTLDGRPGGNGTTPLWTIQNTSTSSGGPAIELTGGADTDTLEYLGILSSNQTGTSGTVYLYNSSSGPSQTADVIQNCNIGPNGTTYPVNGICAYGYSTTYPNSSMKVLNNNIYNFLPGSSSQGCGVYVYGTSTNTDYGDHWTISGNSFYSNVTQVNAYYEYPIYFNAGSGSGTNVISNNYIGGSSANCGGPYWVTRSSSGGSPTTPAFAGIYLNAGTTSVTGNTISNIQSNISAGGNSNGDVDGIYMTGSGNYTVTGNTIGSATTGKSIDYVVNGSNGTLLAGIVNQSSGTIIIGTSASGNTIANLNDSATGTYAVAVGIYSSTGTNSIVNNTIFNIASTCSNNNGSNNSIGLPGSAAGIFMNSALSVSHSISNNTIYGINSNYASASPTTISGIITSIPAASSHNTITDNLIYGLGAPNGNTSIIIKGIELFGSSPGGTISDTLYNNIIDLGLRTDGSAITSSAYIGGIVDSLSGSSTLTLKLYHNSVYIGGTGVTGGTAYNFRRNNVNSSPKDIVDVRNNIFVDNRSGSGTYYNVGYESNTQLSSSTEDWNDYFGNGTGYVLGYIGANETSTSAMASGSGNSNFDTHSLTSDPMLTAPTSVPPNFYLQSGSPALGTGASALLTYDYYGTVRANYVATDLGAVVSLITNLITASNVSSPQCAGASVSVVYTAQGTFTSNTFTAQLSNASGSFTSPTNIGSLTSNVSGTISATLPTSASGSGYLIRVISGNPADTSASTTALTINFVTAPTVSVSNNCGSSTLSTTATGTLAWSPGGAATTSITVTNAATYSVTASSNGCTSVAGTGTSAPLAVPSTPSVSVSNVCGSSTLSTTATGTLAWNTGATTSAITVTNSATYSVTTTAGDGCTSAAGTGTSAPISGPAAPVVNDIDNCNGTSLLYTAATGALSWSTGATTTSILVSAAGTYSVTQTVSGCTSSAGTGVATPGATPSTPSVSAVNNCNGSSTLSTTATGTLSWNTGATTASITVTAAGTYSVTQTVGGCTSAAGTANASLGGCGMSFTVKFFIQGYYLSSSGTMSPLLNLLGVAGATSASVDTVTIELHASSSPYSVVDSYKGILQSTGNIICSFAGSGEAGNAYYIVINHRNSIQTWSASPVTINSGGSYDFTTGAGQAYGNNTVNVGSGVYGIYSGDINQDGAINSSDKQSLQSVISTFKIGVYNVNDITGDGFVDEDDLRILDNNISLNISAQHP